MDGIPDTLFIHANLLLIYFTSLVTRHPLFLFFFFSFFFFFRGIYFILSIYHFLSVDMAIPWTLDLGHTVAWAITGTWTLNLGLGWKTRRGFSLGL